MKILLKGASRTCKCTAGEAKLKITHVHYLQSTCTNHTAAGNGLYYFFFPLRALTKHSWPSRCTFWGVSVAVHVFHFFSSTEPTRARTFCPHVCVSQMQFVKFAPPSITINNHTYTGGVYEYLRFTTDNLVYTNNRIYLRCTSIVRSPLGFPRMLLIRCTQLLWGLWFGKWI